MELCVIPSPGQVRPAPETEAILDEIDFEAENAVIHGRSLPPELTKLENVLVSGARGAAGVGNENRSFSRRVTFFREPNGERVVGLGTFRNTRGDVVVTPIDEDRLRSIRLGELLQAEYHAFATIRLKNARQRFRIILSRGEFSEFLGQALRRKWQHCAAIEQTREAVLKSVSQSSPTSDEAADTDPTEPPAADFIYTFLEVLDATVQGDSDQRDLSERTILAALSRCRVKLLWENLSGRGPEWLPRFLRAVSVSYASTFTIKDPDRRADRFRQLISVRIRLGTLEVAETSAGEEEFDIAAAGSPEPPVLQVQPVTNAKRRRRETSSPAGETASELRARATERLRASDEYRAWSAAWFGSKGPAPRVTVAGAAKFLEFWSPLIDAVRTRLKAILIEVPFSGPVLGFRAK